MDLDQLRGASRHVYGSGTRKLAYMLLLPMFDGVFATLLVSGAVETLSGAVNIAITVFAGAGALAVLLSETDSRAEALKMVAAVTPLFLAATLLVAALAPVYASIFNVETLRIAGAIAVLSIAAELAGLNAGDYLPPSAVLFTGLVLSFQGGNVSLTASYILPALLTAAASLVGLFLASGLAGRSLDLSKVRKAGSMVLGLIAASMMGLQVPTQIGPVILGAALITSARSS